MTTTHEPTTDLSLSPHDSPSRADSQTTRSLTPGHPSPSPTAGARSSSGVDPADYGPALHDAALDQALDQATPLAVPTLTNSPGCTPTTPATSAVPTTPELEPTPLRRFRAVAVDAWSIPASSVQWSRPRTAAMPPRSRASERRRWAPLNGTTI